MNNLPILDTEDKLRAYLNKIAGCEVNTPPSSPESSTSSNE